MRSAATSPSFMECHALRGGCNAYCLDGLHSFLLYGPEHPDMQWTRAALHARFPEFEEITEIRPAPEAPIPADLIPLDPYDSIPPPPGLVAYLVLVRLGAVQP